MDTTEFVILRHGQTADNVAGILQGHRNTPLDDTGRSQAHRAAKRLAGTHFDVIYSSDLLRAFETAEIIGKAVGVTPVPTRDLREWHLGELEGQHSKELWESHFEIMNCFLEDKGDIPVPGGESRYTFEKRVTDFLEKVAEAHIGQSVLLVAHTGVLHAIFKHITGLGAGRCLPLSGNVSYNSAFRYADGRWRLRCWNDVSHLTEVRNSMTF